MGAVAPGMAGKARPDPGAGDDPTGPTRPSDTQGPPLPATSLFSPRRKSRHLRPVGAPSRDPAPWRGCGKHSWHWRWLLRLVSPPLGPERGSFNQAGRRGGHGARYPAPFPLREGRLPLLGGPADCTRLVIGVARQPPQDIMKNEETASLGVSGAPAWECPPSLRLFWPQEVSPSTCGPRTAGIDVSKLFHGAAGPNTASAECFTPRRRAVG